MTEPSPSEISNVIRNFVLEEFLAGEEPGELSDDVELMTLGILDSVGVLKMASFLEARFSIGLSPHELGRVYMNSLRSITSLVASKLTSAP